MDQTQVINLRGLLCDSMKAISAVKCKCLNCSFKTEIIQQ